MTEKSGPGQADKRAAELKTAQVAADSKAEERQSKVESEQAAVQQAKTAAEKVQKSVEAGDDDTVAEEVAVDPYPDYSDKDLSELRSLASSRNVEINRDVEKSHLVAKLREKKGPTPQYDLMPLEQLREAARGEGVELDEEFERAHLITELRAADTHTG